MIYRKLTLVFVFFFSFIMHESYAQIQNKRLEKANEAYNQFAFAEASKLYKRIATKGNASANVYAKLADSYYYNSNYPEALIWYAKLMETRGNIAPEYYFRYAQTLKTAERYSEAATILKKYYLKTGKKDISDNWLPENFMSKIKEQSGRHVLNNVAINSPSSEFGVAFLGEDKLLYATTKNSSSVLTQKNNWDNQSYFKIYMATITPDGGLTNSKILKGDVNSKFHHSTPVITKDGKTMYFTGSNYMLGKLGRSKKLGINYLKIYKAHYIDNQWKNVEELPYPVNSDGFSSGHPALSPDDKELYFVSDRNNEMGNSDLYVGSITEADGVSEIRSLGNEINTLGRETYPFIDASGILYFSSDGHPGLGGLDVFAAVKDEEGIYKVVNLGDGVNSAYDDFTYGINRETQKGYFSSNRDGNDDLYGFTERSPVDFSFNIKPTISGAIKDSITGAPIAGVTIEVFDAEFDKISSYQTDTEGKYSILLEPYQKHTLVYKKVGLIEETVSVPMLQQLEKRVISPDLYNEMEVNVANKRVVLKEGDDLTKTLELEPIYFDYEGSQIRESSKVELDKIVELLLARPNISLRVNSHTDSRGRDEFNLHLSKQRAAATVEYIVKAGVAKERVTGEGFGETRLINKCTNGVKCSEKEHELNRRSEFIIILNK
ncbi:OmpA family protein [Flavobacterium sp. LS1R47]|uniref:OmpA family protein n=1 Tax=Flavobacterium frigoritolerans TaxID=2987686 RepID=A0A9X3CAI4_9FLAO|nr:OmpA family protein [Flavobacterium frigoritolerans]MCV9934635.1 OmpA family protein [Flavobacterium frigoritolerans]